MILYSSRRFDEAVREHRNTLELEPGFLLSRSLLGMSLIEDNRPADAIAELERARIDSGGAALALGMLGHAYARAGRASEAQQVLDELAEKSQKAYVSPFWSALTCTGLRDEERTLHFLELARDERSDWLLFADMTPGFDWLRGHPRFEPFRRLLGGA